MKWSRELTGPLGARAIVSLALIALVPPGGTRGRRWAGCRTESGTGSCSRPAACSSPLRSARSAGSCSSRRPALGGRSRMRCDLRHRRVRQQLPPDRLRRRRSARLAGRLARNPGDRRRYRHRRPGDDAGDGHCVCVAGLRVRARPRPLGARASAGCGHGTRRGGRHGRRARLASGHAARDPAAVARTVGSRLCPVGTRLLPRIGRVANGAARAGVRSTRRVRALARRAVDLPLSIAFFVLAVVVPAVLVVTALPLSLGGLGLREGSYVVLLHQAGVSTTDAALLSLLATVLFALATLPGAFALLTRSSARDPGVSAPTSPQELAS